MNAIATITDALYHDTLEVWNTVESRV